MDEKDIQRAQIKAAIEEELRNITAMTVEMKEYKQKNSKAFRRAKASILHDFYNCCERIFKTIAQDINADVPESPVWHRSLLYRMTTKIQGIRPPVVSKSLAADLDDYLSFRHVFRNIYGFELESDRLDRLVEKFGDVAARFRRETTSFLRKI